MKNFLPSGNTPKKSTYLNDEASYGSYPNNSYTTGTGKYAAESASPKGWTKVFKSSFPNKVLSSSTPDNTDGGTGSGYGDRDTSSLYYTGEATYGGKGGAKRSAPRPAKKEKSMTYADLIPLPASISLGRSGGMEPRGYAEGGMVQPMQAQPMQAQPMGMQPSYAGPASNYPALGNALGGGGMGGGMGRPMQSYSGGQSGWNTPNAPISGGGYSTSSPFLTGQTPPAPQTGMPGGPNITPRMGGQMGGVMPSHPMGGSMGNYMGFGAGSSMGRPTPGGAMPSHPIGGGMGGGSMGSYLGAGMGGGMGRPMPGGGMGSAIGGGQYRGGYAGPGMGQGMDRPAVAPSHPMGGPRRGNDAGYVPAGRAMMPGRGFYDNER